MNENKILVNFFAKNNSRYEILGCNKLLKDDPRPKNKKNKNKKQLKHQKYKNKHTHSNI